MARDGGAEVVGLTVISFFYFILLSVYMYVPLNSVYTHQGLETGDIPHLSNLGSNVSHQKRFNIDYVVQWITLPLAWGVLFVSFLSLYYIAVGRQSMVWLYVSWCVLAFAAWLAKLLYEVGISLLFCSNWAFCTREDPSAPKSEISPTFLYRTLGTFFIMIFIAIYIILGFPLAMLEERKQNEDVKQQ